MDAEYAGYTAHFLHGMNTLKIPVLLKSSNSDNHGQKSLRHMEITIIFSLDVNSPLPRREM